MNPNLQLILLAHPRSGSSSLFQILQLHPALDLLNEPFNENFTRWQPDHPRYRDAVSDVDSLDAQLAAIFASYNGLKLLDYQLPDNLLAHLLHEPSRHVLFLRRRNLLQSVVSLLIAEQTALWKKWEATQPLASYYRNLQPLDVDEIQHRIEELNEHLTFCESLVDARPVAKTMKLVYEELYFAPAAQREQQIAAVWPWLGLALLDSERVHYYLDPAQVKMNSAATYALVPNADEIERRCGNDGTGWLYL